MYKWLVLHSCLLLLSELVLYTYIVNPYQNHFFLYQILYAWIIITVIMHNRRTVVKWYQASARRAPTTSINSDYTYMKPYPLYRNFFYKEKRFFSSSSLQFKFFRLSGRKKERSKIIIKKPDEFSHSDLSSEMRPRVTHLDLHHHVLCYFCWWWWLCVWCDDFVER